MVSVLVVLRPERVENPFSVHLGGVERTLRFGPAPYLGLAQTHAPPQTEKFHTLIERRQSLPTQPGLLSPQCQAASRTLVVDYLLPGL